MRYVKGVLSILAVCSMVSVAAATETYVNDCTSVAPEWTVRAPLTNLRVSTDGQAILTDFPAGTTGYEMIDLGLGSMGNNGFTGAPIVVTDKTMTVRMKYDYTGTGPTPGGMMGCWIRIYSGTKNPDGTWAFVARQAFFVNLKPNAGWETFSKSFADTPPEDLYGGIPLDTNNVYKARFDFVFWDAAFSPGTFGVEHFEISPAKAPVISASVPSPDEAYPGVEYTKEFQLLQGGHPVTISKLQGPTNLVAGLVTPYTAVPYAIGDTTSYQAIKVNGWTPTDAEVGQTYTVEIKAENGAGSDTKSWTVKVVQLPPIINPVTPDPNPALAGSVYDKQLTLTQGTPPITWSVVSGPTGLTVDSTGTLGGWTPLSDQTGQTFPITVRAANSLGSDDVSWTAVVQNVPPVIKPLGANPDSAYQGVEYVRKLFLSAGAPVVTWSIDQGLPGMVISQSGKLTGWTPTTAGTYTVTVRAANNHGIDFDTETWQVNVVPAPTGAEVAAPWGTIHANNFGTQSSNAPSIKFKSAEWLNGAQVDWILDVKALGLDRPSDRGGMSFDEAGNIHWKSNNGLLVSVSPAGAVRWTGNVGGTPVNLGTPDASTPVVDNNGTAGNVYVLTDTGAAAFRKSDGTQVWATSIPGTNFAGTGNRMTPVLYAGKLYVVGSGIGTKVVAQLDATTGNLDWSSSIAGFDAEAPGQMALVPNALAPGVHGLYFNASGGTGASMYCVAIYPMFALLDWKDTGGNTAHSHVMYIDAVKCVATPVYGDDSGGPMLTWNLDGTGKSVKANQANSKHGYYDQGCLDFNGQDIVAGGFNGQIVRYKDFKTYVPACDPPVFFDTGGFEGYADGPLGGQNGWIDASAGGGVAAQVVTFGGTKCVRLEVPDVVGAQSIAKYPFEDFVKKGQEDGYKVIQVSFDIYRVADAYPQNFWWYWVDPGDFTGGGQWDISLGRPVTTGGSSPFWSGWVPTVMDTWTNFTLTWNMTTGQASGSYNGGTPITGTFSNIVTLTEFWFELAHAENSWDGTNPAPTDAQVLYVDNFVVRACKDGGSAGGPSATGYYQLDPAYGEARSYGGLYQDTAGKSIFISGTNSVGGLTAKVYAFNVTDNTLYTETPATAPPPPDLQSPLFAYDTGVIRDHSFTVVGGPQLGPTVGSDTQHIYYFNGDASGALIALKGKPRFMPDCNNDGKVNRDDLDLFFIPCFTGPMVQKNPPAGVDCSCADLNMDSFVDQTDFGLFQKCMSGDLTTEYDPNCYP